MDPRVL
jgi:hypothetical protein